MVKLFESEMANQNYSNPFEDVGIIVLSVKILDKLLFRVNKSRFYIEERNINRHILLGRLSLIHI